MLRRPPVAPRLPPDTATSPRFLPDDRLPAPQPVEHEGEAAWDEFQQLLGVTANDQAFAPTLPPDMAPDGGPSRTLTGPALQPRPPEPLTVHDVMVEARRFNRVCPLPPAWHRLYELLPDKVTTGRQWQPPPPICGDAWVATSALPKRMCLREHIEWAAAHGVLGVVLQFLKSLPEAQWHHVGDPKRI